MDVATPRTVGALLLLFNSLVSGPFFKCSVVVALVRILHITVLHLNHGAPFISLPVVVQTFLQFLLSKRTLQRDYMSVRQAAY